MSIQKDAVLDNDPRLVELCLNCSHRRCLGTCEEYVRLRHEISPFTGKAKYTGKLWEIDGRAQTLTQWAYEYGILERTLRKRVEAGVPIREALEMGVRRAAKLYTAFGRTQSLPTWGDEYGIKPRTLEQRMKRGMTLEQALKAPLPGGAKGNG